MALSRVNDENIRETIKNEISSFFGSEFISERLEKLKKEKYYLKELDSLYKISLHEVFNYFLKGYDPSLQDTVITPTERLEKFIFRFCDKQSLKTKTFSQRAQQVLPMIFSGATPVKIANLVKDLRRDVAKEVYYKGYLYEFKKFTLYYANEDGTNKFQPKRDIIDDELVENLESIRKKIIDESYFQSLNYEYDENSELYGWNPYSARAATDSNKIEAQYKSALKFELYNYFGGIQNNYYFGNLCAVESGVILSPILFQDSNANLDATKFNSTFVREYSKIIASDEAGLATWEEKLMDERETENFLF